MVSYGTKTTAHWDHVFTCLSCGQEHRQRDSLAPERWTEDPDVTYHEPGSRPPETVRDPDGWRGAERDSAAEKALVRDCWTMVDSLQDAVTIHHFTFVWDIDSALEAQDMAGLVAAAAEYVNLLDYEAIHRTDLGSYDGAEGDVSALRVDLDRIPLARELRAGRASRWRPPHRLA